MAWRLEDTFMNQYLWRQVQEHPLRCQDTARFLTPQSNLHIPPLSFFAGFRCQIRISYLASFLESSYPLA